MRIARVAASNWRNFKQLDFELDNRLFVVGPNASGKSNLLDIFRFMSDVASRAGGLSAAVESRGGLSKLRSLFARNHKKGRLILEFHLEDGSGTWIYRLAVRGEQGGKNRTIVDEEHVEHNGDVLLHRPDESDRNDPELLTQTHLEQISANQPFRPIADHFARAQYLHPVPQIMRDTTRTGSAVDKPFGANVIADINSVPARTRSAWLDRIQRALQSAVPEFESLRLEQDRAGRPHLVAGYRNWRQAPSHQSEADFSDGTLRLIGLLWTLVSTPANSGALLLEEPEISLNASIVRMLPTVLATAQRNQDLQMILSTHSPEILNDQGVLPREVLVLEVTKEGTHARLLSDIPDAEVLLDAGLPKSEIVDGLVAPEDLSGLIDATAGRR